MQVLILFYDHISIFVHFFYTRCLPLSRFPYNFRVTWSTHFIYYVIHVTVCYYLLVIMQDRQDRLLEVTIIKFNEKLLIFVFKSKCHSLNGLVEVKEFFPLFLKILIIMLRVVFFHNYYLHFLCTEQYKLISLTYTW